MIHENSPNARIIFFFLSTFDSFTIKFLPAPKSNVKSSLRSMEFYEHIYITNEKEILEIYVRYTLYLVLSLFWRSDICLRRVAA